MAKKAQVATGTASGRTLGQCKVIDRRSAQRCRKCGESIPRGAAMCAGCGRTTTRVLTRHTDPAHLRPRFGPRKYPETGSLGPSSPSISVLASSPAASCDLRAATGVRRVAIADARSSSTFPW